MTCSEVMSWLESRKQITEDEWVKSYLEDVSKHHAIERINKLKAINDIHSYSNEHPVVQTTLANFIICRYSNPNLMEFLYQLNFFSEIIDPEMFAINLLKDAALNKKYVEAKKVLVSYYSDKQSDAQILYWLNSAAEDGCADAMRQLYRSYGLGIGVPRDHAEMIKWLSLADAKGDLNSKVLMKTFIKNNFYKEGWFIEGLNRARQWQEQHMSLFMHQ